MRNIVEYPVTVEEVIDAMEESLALLQEKHKGEYGTISPLAMRYAIYFLKEHSNFPYWLENMPRTE